MGQVDLKGVLLMVLIKQIEKRRRERERMREREKSAGGVID